MLEKFDLDIWEYIFRNFLTIKCLCTLSRVSKHIYCQMHQIKAYEKLHQNPLDYMDDSPVAQKIIHVIAWKNIAFTKFIPTPDNIKPDYHFIFHTWGYYPNVYFLIHTRKYNNLDKIINKYRDRIYFLSTPGVNLPKKVTFKYISFSGHLPEDVEFSKNIKLVNINHSCIKDISIFSRMREIRLCFCNHITDISPLKGMFKVVIISCELLEDISPLRNSYDVSIQYCSNVKNFSSLGYVKKLSLMGCGVDKLDFLVDTEELDISFCRKIRDIHPLKNLKKLKTLYLWNKKDIPGLWDLKNIKIIHC